jgi:uncharacterized protein (DUF2249 family)
MYQKHTKQTLIDELLAIRELGWIPSRRNRANAGAVGNTLEDLLGIQENNLPFPDAGEWELKAQRMKTSSLLTLFHMEPSPRIFNIVPYLLEKYGWEHKEAGRRYPKSEKSFRQTLIYRQKTNRGFYVDIDDINRRIIVNFSFDDIEEGLEVWKTDVLKRSCTTFESSHIPYWSFDDVFHKAELKLGNCFCVVADEKRINGELYFKYSKIMMLSGFKTERFIETIKDKHILIDFDARTGHNHGTKFRIKQSAIPLLYENVTIF